MYILNIHVDVYLAIDTHTQRDGRASLIQSGEKNNVMHFDVGQPKTKIRRNFGASLAVCRQSLSDCLSSRGRALTGYIFCFVLFVFFISFLKPPKLVSWNIFKIDISIVSFFSYLFSWHCPSTRSFFLDIHMQCGMDGVSHPFRIVQYQSNISTYTTKRKLPNFVIFSSSSSFHIEKSFL